MPNFNLLSISSLGLLLTCGFISCNENAESNKKENAKSTDIDSEELLNESFNRICDCMVENFSLEKGEELTTACVNSEMETFVELNVEDAGAQLKRYMTRECPDLIERFNQELNKSTWAKNILDSMSTPNCDSIKELTFLEFDYFLNLDYPDSIVFNNNDICRTELIWIDDCNHKMIIKEVYDSSDGYEVGDTLLRKYAGQYKDYVLIEDVLFNGAETKTLYKVIAK